MEWQRVPASCHQHQAQQLVPFPRAGEPHWGLCESPPGSYLPTGGLGPLTEAQSGPSSFLPLCLYLGYAALGMVDLPAHPW